MNDKRFKWLFVFALLCAAVLIIFALYPKRHSLSIDLRDGSRLELVAVSVSTNHVMHFGNLPQRLTFKIAGARLPEKWVGHEMNTPAQDSRNGNLGLFVRHRLSAAELAMNNVHNYKIEPVTQPNPNHPMFLSSGAGGFGLWELNYWTTNHPNFVIKDSKGVPVARFRISGEPNAGYEIRQQD